MKFRSYLLLDIPDLQSPGNKSQKKKPNLSWRVFMFFLFVFSIVIFSYATSILTSFMTIRKDAFLPAAKPTGLRTVRVVVVVVGGLL